MRQRALWGKGAVDGGNSSREVEEEGAEVEKRPQTGNELEKVIEKLLRLSLEEAAHQRGQTGGVRERSRDLQEGSQVMVG